MRELKGLHACPALPCCPAATAWQVEPKFLSITNYHVIAASDDLVYVWQFRTSFTKMLSTDIAAVKRKDVREKTFHIDDANPAMVRRAAPPRGCGCVCKRALCRGLACIRPDLTCAARAPSIRALGAA